MEKKKERRGWAVTLLATIGSPSALKALDARLDDEPDDEVRDAMLLALDAARAASGGQVTRDEIGERVIRAAKKLQAPIAAWLDESRLPPLTYTDGEPLGPEATRFLLYRQSRAKEIRPDVEARPLYAMIDRKTGADFALELFRQFAATKADAADRWVLTVTGLLGDDRVVPTLNSMIQQWADSARGKMAEYGVQALALLGTDAALTMVDALALRYRTKNKNIGAAAVGRLCRGRRTARDDHRRAGRPRRPLARASSPASRGSSSAAASGSRWRSVPTSSSSTATSRRTSRSQSLPKSAPKEILAQLKNEAAILKDVSKGQKARIENLMVRQHRWPVEPLARAVPRSPDSLPVRHPSGLGWL